MFYSKYIFITTFISLDSCFKDLLTMRASPEYIGLHYKLATQQAVNSETSVKNDPL